MKKKSLTILFLLLMGGIIIAEGNSFLESLASNREVATIKIDPNNRSNNFKLGVALGYPSGITAGWRPSNLFEANLLLGTNYGAFTIGVSPLFTIANLDIEGEIFPLTVGPAINLHLNGFGLDMDILAMIRLEYSFSEIPLNLFLEGGAGVNLNFKSVFAVRFGGSGALGIRYIF